MDTIIDKYMDKLRSWIPDWFTPTVTLLYLCSMLIIFPYFNTEKMFHLFLDKRDYFLVTSIVYLCVMLPRILIALYDWGNDMYAPKKPDIIFALVLLAAFAISTVYSRDIRMTFFEMTSRTISGLFFLRSGRVGGWTSFCYGDGLPEARRSISVGFYVPAALISCTYRTGLLPNSCLFT